MANRNNPQGLVPRYHLAGGEIRTEPVALKSTNSAIGRGDPVVAAAGVYDVWSSGPVFGVAAEAKSASNGSATINVYKDPNIVYSMQCDSTTGTLTAAADIDLNATIVMASPVNSISQAQIDESSGNTTATLPLKIRGLYPNPANSFGQYNELYCTLNNNPDKGGTGTLGT